MLVLGRKPGERVFVGNDIEIVVLEVRGDRVKLGFNAPADLAIQRGELHLHQGQGGWFPALEHAECA
jgi:carbon storage regulator